MFAIVYSNGDPSDTFDDYGSACEYCNHQGWIYGHDGDISDGGARTLIWESEEDSEGDDGANALASIVDQGD